MPYVLDPYHIATNGITGAPLTIATNGWIVELTEEIESPPSDIALQQIFGGGGVEGQEALERLRRKYEKEKVKKITARVTIEGRVYVETVYVKDVKLNLKDVSVKVDMNEQKVPKISIIFPEK